MNDFCDAKLEQKLLNKSNVHDVDSEDCIFDRGVGDTLHLDQYVPHERTLSNEEMMIKTNARIFERLSVKLTDMLTHESHLIKSIYDSTESKYFDIMVRDIVERVRVYADMIPVEEVEPTSTVCSIGNYILEYETSNKHAEAFANLLVDVIDQHDLNNKLADTFITVSLVMTQKYLNTMNAMGWNNVAGYGVLIPGKKDKEVDWSPDYGKYHLPIKVSTMVKSSPVYLRTFYIYAIANN